MNYNFIKESKDGKTKKYHWFDHVNQKDQVLETIKEEHVLVIKYFERDRARHDLKYQLVDQREFGLDFAKVIAHSLS